MYKPTCLLFPRPPNFNTANKTTKTSSWKWVQKQVTIEIILIARAKKRKTTWEAQKILNETVLNEDDKVSQEIVIFFLLHYEKCLLFSLFASQVHPSSNWSSFLSFSVFLRLCNAFVLICSRLEMQQRCIKEERRRIVLILLLYGAHFTMDNFCFWETKKFFCGLVRIQ